MSGKVDVLNNKRTGDDGSDIRACLEELSEQQQTMLSLGHPEYIDAEEIRL